MGEPILIHVDDRGVATITLNRPDLRNAFDANLITRLDDAIATLGADPEVRLIVLTGAGKAFSAGADINWMRSMGRPGKSCRSRGVRISSLMEVSPSSARVMRSG